MAEIDDDQDKERRQRAGAGEEARGRRRARRRAVGACEAADADDEPDRCGFEREAAETRLADDRPMKSANSHHAEEDRDRWREKHHGDDGDRAGKERGGADARPAACHRAKKAGKHDARYERRIVRVDIGIVKRKRRQAGERAERIEIGRPVAKTDRRGAGEKRSDINHREAGNEEKLGRNGRCGFDFAKKQTPGEACRDARDGEPAPGPDARHAEHRCRHREDVEHDREGRRLGV